MKMIQYPIDLTLKDETKVTVRPAEIEDVEGLVEFFKCIPKSDLLIYKDDVSKRETVDSWFINPNYKKLIQLIAVRDNEIVGKGTLHNQGLYWENAAEAKLLVKPEWRGKGLGSQMFKFLLYEGLDRHFQKLIVRLTPGNISFKKILDHYGFDPEAVLNYYIEDEETKEHDDLIIASYNIEDWERRFEFYNLIYRS